MTNPKRPTPIETISRQQPSNKTAVRNAPTCCIVPQPGLKSRTSRKASAFLGVSAVWTGDNGGKLIDPHFQAVVLPLPTPGSICGLRWGSTALSRCRCRVPARNPRLEFEQRKFAVSWASLWMIDAFAGVPHPCRIPGRSAVGAPSPGGTTVAFEERWEILGRQGRDSPPKGCLRRAPGLDQVGSFEPRRGNLRGARCACLRRLHRRTRSPGCGIRLTHLGSICGRVGARVFVGASPRRGPSRAPNMPQTSGSGG